ncbi:hypothetical protein Tco_1364140 [Tanacetum coccineum]
MWYHRSGGGYELTKDYAPTKDCTLTLGYGVTAPEEAGNANPPHSLPVCDASWTLVGFPGLLLRNQLANFTQLDHQWYQVHYWEHIGSGASGGGRATPKKEACSSRSFHQKDGSARIVLDERIT